MDADELNDSYEAAYTAGRRDGYNDGRSDRWADRCCLGVHEVPRMTTYYHRRKADGEIVNASEFQGSLVELEHRWPMKDCYYDAHPPIEVLQRYRYWDERP